MTGLGKIENESQLEAVLSDPYPEDIEAAGRLGGDLLVLGAGGKMGPTLVRRALQAIQASGKSYQVHAVSRFTNPAEESKLRSWGARTIQADLLEVETLETLPECQNVIYMVGSKFGTSGNESFTWATNAFLPGAAVRRFRDSRIVAWSTGNVYPLVPIDSKGCAENEPPGPIGEYAQSCLGRERVLQFFSERYSIPICILRLNYAVEARYGVLVDIARKVRKGVPVSLDMGYFNAIWQGDANSVCLRALALCRSPAEVVNVTGADTLSVREVATAFGDLFDVTVEFEGREHSTALLSNAARCGRLFGPPQVPIPAIMELVADWLKKDGTTWDKPTKFEVRNGRF